LAPESIAQLRSAEERFAPAKSVPTKQSWDSSSDEGFALRSRSR
jgi:hypothetical protein